MFRSNYQPKDYLYNHNLREKHKKEYQLTKKNMEKIKQIFIKQIKYPEFEEAYEYVDKLFPRVKVKEIAIYKVMARDLEKMGYGGAEGFYDTISKSIVVGGERRREVSLNRGSIQAKVERDEVIVHELCHYCYVFEGNRSVSSQQREEFAYGWSIGYLRQKGYSNEYIIRYNFLPYLVNISYEQATKNVLAWNDISISEYNAHSKFKRIEFKKMYGRKILERAKEIGIEKGQKIIDLYTKKIEEGTGYFDEEEDEELTRFDYLDL